MLTQQHTRINLVRTSVLPLTPPYSQPFSVGVLIIIMIIIIIIITLVMFDAMSVLCNTGADVNVCQASCWNMILTICHG
jgi:hypothetical protein